MAIDEKEIHRILDRIDEVLQLWRRTQDRRTKRILRERLHAVYEEAEDPETTRRLYKEIEGIETMKLTLDDLGAMREIQVMYRPEWELTFSVDNTGAFPQVRWGRTPVEERMCSRIRDVRPHCEASSGDSRRHRTILYLQ